MLKLQRRHIVECAFALLVLVRDLTDKGREVIDKHESALIHHLALLGDFGAKRANDQSRVHLRRRLKFLRVEIVGKRVVRFECKFETEGSSDRMIPLEAAPREIDGEKVVNVLLEISSRHVTAEVAVLVALCSFTFAFGTILMFGIVLVSEPHILGPLKNLSPWFAIDEGLARGIGVALLAFCALRVTVWRSM